MYVPFHALSQLAHSWPQQGVEAQSNAYLVDSHTSVFGLPRALLATRHLATTVALQVQRWPRQGVVGAGVGAHHELVATMHEATQQGVEAIWARVDAWTRNVCARYCACYVRPRVREKKFNPLWKSGLREGFARCLAMQEPPSVPRRKPCTAFSHLR